MSKETYILYQKRPIYHIERDLKRIPGQAQQCQSEACQKRPICYTKRDQYMFKETYREYRARLGSVRAQQVHKAVTVPQNPLRIATLASAVFTKRDIHIVEKRPRGVLLQWCNTRCASQ